MQLYQDLPILYSTVSPTLHRLNDLPKLTFTELRGFHGSFATGVACQQGALTLPDTWFRPPFWDLLVLQLLRPNSSNLPCLYSTFHIEYPLVLSRFCSTIFYISIKIIVALSRKTKDITQCAISANKSTLAITRSNSVIGVGATAADIWYEVMNQLSQIRLSLTKLLTKLSIDWRRFQQVFIYIRFNRHYVVYQ